MRMFPRALCGALAVAALCLGACNSLASAVTTPIAQTVAAHSDGTLVQAGDTVQLSLTAARTAALVQVDAAGAYKLSARAFLAADDAGAFATSPALKAALKADLAKAIAAYHGLRKLGAAATADQFAAQRALLSAALTDVNQALHVPVPVPASDPSAS